MTDFTADELNDHAKRMFPLEWAKMEGLTGKARSRDRQRLRYAARYELITAPLTAAGHACRDCKHWEKVPHDDKKGTRHCALESDFHGYVIMPEDYICTEWKAK